jgi:hypothetical protein
MPIAYPLGAKNRNFLQYTVNSKGIFLLSYRKSSLPCARKMFVLKQKRQKRNLSISG